ncbi:MAG TPA: asparagine synthase (glutamine-hydrolyzing) [Candidatus Acidoferrales bacterium]|nr:asparagine synthase (glutamine-hydrolyzing) [Candidatus Acidoferrales bacterium]
MCGIAGLYARTGPVDLGRLAHLARLLRHRGPDDEGLALFDARSGAWRTHGGPDTPADVFAAPLGYAPGRSGGDARDAVWSVALLHRRLSIVDLKPSGHQPMCDRDGRTWITYNGEVYNFPELRDELRALGHAFASTSDTEVILAAYREWGEDCLAHFNGMFGLALWDAARRVLFCARDRLGVKPFYWQWDGRTFAFASEPRALVLTQSRAPRARAAAVRDLLALDWVDHGAGTFFEGLELLPPAHCLTVRDEGVRVRRWWTIDPGSRVSGPPEELARRYGELFTDAVRLRLRADVEVGTCLSGGLDSSAVITTAAGEAKRGLHAFSCAYDAGPSFDERPFMRLAAGASGATLHLTVPDGADFWTTFDALALSQGEPTAGPGLYSQWHVMRIAHEAGLKVLLDGQGGDETLAGYFRYLPTRLRDLALTGRWLELARAFGPVAARLGVATTVLHGLEPLLPAALVNGARARLGQGKDRVLSSALARVASRPPGWPQARRSALWRHLAFDTLTRQLPSLLRYEDRNSMAFSIETRLPFLDYRLVELAFALPDEARLEGVTTKAVARRAFAGRVPAAILARRDKMGFETPSDAWLRGPCAAEARRRLARPGPFQDWVDRDELAAQLDGFLAGRRAIGLQVWRWLSLEAWSHVFLDRDPRVSGHSGEPPSSAGAHVGVATRWEQLARDRGEGAFAL